MVHIKHKKTLITIIAILVLTGLAVGGYVVWQYMTATTDTATEEEAVVLTAEERAAQDKFAEIDAERQTEAEANLTSASTSAARAQAYIDLANVATSNDEALRYALKAVEEDKNANTLQAAMHFANIAGDTSTYEQMYNEYATLGIDDDWDE